MKEGFFFFLPFRTIPFLSLVIQKGSSGSLEGLERKSIFKFVIAHKNLILIKIDDHCNCVHMFN